MKFRNLIPFWVLGLTLLAAAFAYSATSPVGTVTGIPLATVTSCSVTWTAVTSNPTLGTITSEVCSIDTNGKKVHAYYALNVTNTGGANGSGTYLISIPGGGTIDTTKHTADTGCDYGIGFVQLNQGGTFGQGHVGVYDSTHLCLKLTAGNDTPAVMAHGYFGFADAKKLSFNIDFYIQ